MSANKAYFNQKTIFFRLHGRRKPQEKPPTVSEQEAVTRISKEIGIERYQAARFLNGRMPNVPALRLAAMHLGLYREADLDKWLETYSKEMAKGE